MKQYLDLAKHILKNGVKKDDRTGVGTLSTFGYQMRFDLNKGFPCLTTKKLHLKSIIHELLWFLKGDINIDYLNKNGVHIWDEWANKENELLKPKLEKQERVNIAVSSDMLNMSKEELVNKLDSFKSEALGHKFLSEIGIPMFSRDLLLKKKGDLGPIYGKQWRDWSGSFGRSIDQIKNAINTIKNNPDSRRNIVSAWNVGELNKMNLPPCHILWQLYVANGKLSLQLYQRSADVFLGVPFNIASYSLLLMMLAQVTGLQAGEFIHTMGDAHIYINHIPQMKLQIERDPKELPIMKINSNVTDIDDFVFEDFKLEGYCPHPHIKGKVAV